MSSDGILLTAHGTIERLEDLPEFLRRIRHGRPVEAELLTEMERRYRAIGRSPLLDITRAQAAALAERLGLPVFVGMRLFRPELSEAIAEAARAQVRRLCVLPLAPFSVHVYSRAAERAVAESGTAIELVPAAPFGTDPSFTEAEAQAIEPYLAREPDELLILTAHSLPESVIAAGDPYRTLVEASAEAIGRRLGCPYELAYQSQGADGGAWLGPDLRSVLENARKQGRTRVVVAPFGFLSDHVETRYDLDIEARGWAAELDLEFQRVPALNTDPHLIGALAEAAWRALFG
jgi:ferrochelatase